VIPRACGEKGEKDLGKKSSGKVGNCGKGGSHRTHDNNRGGQIQEKMYQRSTGTGKGGFTESSAAGIRGTKPTSLPKVEVKVKDNCRCVSRGDGVLRSSEVLFSGKTFPKST